MVTMKISIPDTVCDWLSTKVVSGEYASASDCLRDLIRDRMASETKLESFKLEIRKGFESGPSENSWSQLLESLKR